MSSILVTGGTGSFGQACIRRLLDQDDYDRVVVFSRDELKQHDMRCAGLTDERLRYFIGDVRDVDRLRRAFRGVDVVVHAAALKQVESCEFNPLEAKKTNIDGTQNVIDAALDCGVGRVLMVGTDKSVDAINLYGKTKAVAEALMVDANAYSGEGGTRFSCTRYGNVISSRGAVLPLFQAQHAAGQTLTVTDPAMTRFVLTLEQGVNFVLDCVGRMRGGEVFVPLLPAVTVATVAEAVTGNKDWRVVGRRAGEKRHELLVSWDESPRARRIGARYVDEHMFVIEPVSSGPGGGAPFVFGSDCPLAPRLDVQGFRALAGMETTT